MLTQSFNTIIPDIVILCINTITNVSDFSITHIYDDHLYLACNLIIEMGEYL